MTLDLDLRLRVHALGEWVAAEPSFTPLEVDARHPIAAGAVRPGRAHARRRRRAPRPGRGRAAGRSTTWSSTAASCTSRCRGTTPRRARRSTRYMRVVRDDAPWCPWNIEFIRRVNGLDDVDAVRDIVFDAEYLVLGLGDVYLGAPVAMPVDPRHRLVTTKYNPARTWTPENAVGIGGAYLCIYGMEGPGGYQFVGRTVPVWSTYGRERHTTAAEPVAAPVLRPHPLVPGRRPTSCSTCAPTRRPDASTCASTTAPSRGPSTARSSPSTPRRSTPSATRREGAFADERARWAASGEFDARRRAGRTPRCCRRSRRRAAARWRVRGGGAAARLRGATARRARATASRRATAVVTLEAMKTESSVPSPDRRDRRTTRVRRGHGRGRGHAAGRGGRRCVSRHPGRSPRRARADLARRCHRSGR